MNLDLIEDINYFPSIYSKIFYAFIITIFLISGFLLKHKFKIRTSQKSVENNKEITINNLDPLSQFLLEKLTTV